MGYTWNTLLGRQTMCFSNSLSLSHWILPNQHYRQCSSLHVFLSLIKLNKTKWINYKKQYQIYFNLILLM